MKQNENYYTWKKGDTSSLNEYFKCSEFDCQCKHKECVEQKVSVKLIELLTKLRVELNSSVTINSGFRCPTHQKEVAESGVSTVVAKKSQHELGEAVDCSFKGHRTDDVYPLASKYFKAIGIAKTFLHLDTRMDKERRWYY